MNNVFRSVGLMRDLNNMTLIDPNAKDDAQASAEVPKIGSLLALHNWSADFQNRSQSLGDGRNRSSTPLRWRKTAFR